MCGTWVIIIKLFLETIHSPKTETLHTYNGSITIHTYLQIDIELRKISFLGQTIVTITNTVKYFGAHLYIYFHFNTYYL